MIKLENMRVKSVSEAFKVQVDHILNERLKLAWSAKEDHIITQALTPRGQDRFFTRLKRLPYQKFSSLKAPDGQIYLCGKTDDIHLKLDDVLYNLGPYYVATSTQAIINKQSTPVHFFPEYNPLTHNRHLHHFADRYTGFDHPLMADGRTCWASVGPSYMSALSDGDIVDMFRILYIFLIRLDWHSPYCTQWVWEAKQHGVCI